LKKNRFDVVIIGGGLAGLVAAAKLAKNKRKVLLVERGKLGGRATTASIKGFDFNMGAHAVYAKDRTVLSKLEKELSLDINWLTFSPRRAIYDLGDKTSAVPSNLKGLWDTKLLTGWNKISFGFFVLKTMLGIQKGEKGVTIKNWLDKNKIGEQTKETLLSIASSNFFTKNPENIPSDVFFDYYKSVFKTKHPVSYVEGGWKTLIVQFEKAIKENGGEIIEKTKIMNIEQENGVVKSVSTAKEVYFGKDFIFAIPPVELEKLFGDKMEKYKNQKAVSVAFYDIGLKNRIQSPYSYVYNKRERMFITDISYYDKTCTPEGGQLLQAVAYINEEDNPDTIKEKLEEMYDKQFPGWREELVVTKFSNKATVQEIKWELEQVALPIHFDEMQNAYFCGDWCKGKGQLSELSFSTADEVSNKILEN